MYNNIDEIVDYIIDNKCTLRVAAKEYNMPKSTLYDKLKKYMEECDEYTYRHLREVFDNNIKNRNKNGGKAFKIRYTGKKRIDICKKNVKI